MEKDHFLDRPSLVNEHDSILPGDEVFICLKNMQPYAKELQDLTKITVTNYLTSQPYHPRGQKVKGYEKIWNEELQEYEQEERVGRITYKIVNGNVVPTKEGNKYIYRYGKNKLKLVKFEEIKDKYILNLVLSFKDFKFKLVLDKWIYFDSIEEAEKYIKKQNISECKLTQDKIFIKSNNIPEEFNDVNIYIKNKIVDAEIEDIFEYFTTHYESSNNASFNFNKTFDLEIDSFELTKPKEINTEGDI